MNEVDGYCVYRIVCSANSLCYVGQTSDFKYRIRTHFRELAHGSHINAKLQEAYIRYERDSFWCELLERDIPAEKVNEREAWWIAHFDSRRNGFNLTRGNRATITLPQKNTQRKRQREVNFQGWYDPEDVDERAVIETFEYLQTRYGLTPKQLIARAVLQWAENDNLNAGVQHDVPFPKSETLEHLTGMLARLIGMIENGSFIPTNDAAQAAYDEDTVQFDAISASVGSHYRPMSFEDED